MDTLFDNSYERRTLALLDSSPEFPFTKEFIEFATFTNEYVLHSLFI